MLQAVYAYHQSEVKDLKSAQAFLKKSIVGIEDTFMSIFQFPHDLFHYVKLNYDPLEKHIKRTNEEAIEYELLSGNKCLQLLEHHEKSKNLFSAPSYNWASDPDFLKLIYNQVSEADWIQEFKNGEPDFEKSREFLSELFKYLIEVSDEFNIKMEEINLHWSDEKIPILKSLERLLKSCDEKGEMIQMPLISKDLDDDLDYARKLLEYTTQNHTTYENLISVLTPDWDSERIARLDMYIMVMALAEFMEFQSIPVKVTINEYLELAKIYSTPQSSKFINGVLDKLLSQLRTEGKVKKIGRGLVE